VVPVLSSSNFSLKIFQFAYFKEALQVNSPSDTVVIKQLMTDMRFNNTYVPSTILMMASKSWLVGFIEAEGSFFITKDRRRFSLLAQRARRICTWFFSMSKEGWLYLG
jgi:hypothetical protein